MDQQNKKIPLFVAVLLISVAVWASSNSEESPRNRLLATSYQTNPTRTNSVGVACAGKDRNNLVSAADNATASAWMSSLNSNLGINGY